MSNIDWSQLVTNEMKIAAEYAREMTAAKTQLSSKNSSAALQIARIQDRIETLSYGIDIGEASPEDMEESESLSSVLKIWKKYKFDLGKVTAKENWYQSPIWPEQPETPEIVASPERSDKSI